MSRRPTRRTTRREPRKTERFHQIPIFSRLSGQETARVLKITKEIEVPAGDDVFKPGDPPDSFYIILDGRVNIHIPNPESEAHEVVPIATLANRSVFGEMSFLGNRPRSAFASAAQDTRLNKVNGEEFRALIDKGDLAAYKVIHNFALLVSSRLRRVENELMQVVNKLEPESRQERLAELQEFRNTLFQEWSF